MDAKTPLPTGTVTFLFTDIEGSTRLWEQHPEAMRLALARHDVLRRLRLACRPTWRRERAKWPVLRCATEEKPAVSCKCTRHRRRGGGMLGGIPRAAGKLSRY
jgi:Adenylate and Guanylate cyclase catalytic domain